MALPRLQAAADTRAGGRIVDDRGREVLLRGVNVTSLAAQWKASSMTSVLAFGQRDRLARLEGEVPAALADPAGRGELRLERRDAAEQPLEHAGRDLEEVLPHDHEVALHRTEHVAGGAGPGGGHRRLGGDHERPVASTPGRVGHVHHVVVERPAGLVHGQGRDALGDARRRGAEGVGDLVHRAEAGELEEHAEAADVHTVIVLI